MTAIIAPAPIGMPGLLALLAGLILFVAALLLVGWRQGLRPGGGANAGAGPGRGFWLQAAAFALVAIGPLRPTLLPGSAAAVGEAVLVATLIGVCISMFLSAAAALGRNWSVASGTRRDHDLVTWGPFATIRHPIYTGLLALLFAVAIAFGHWRGLVLALPLFAYGTWLRVEAEERGLRAQFGAQYDAYAQQVKRFLPGIF